MIYVMSSLIGIKLRTVNTYNFPIYTHNFHENIESIFIVCKLLTFVKIAKFSSTFLSFIYYELLLQNMFGVWIFERTIRLIALCLGEQLLHHIIFCYNCVSHKSSQDLARFMYYWYSAPSARLSDSQGPVNISKLIWLTWSSSLNLHR